jgi:hypothetical protein
MYPGNLDGGKRRNARTPGLQGGRIAPTHGSQRRYRHVLSPAFLVGSVQWKRVRATDKARTPEQLKDKRGERIPATDVVPGTQRHR